MPHVRQGRLYLQPPKWVSSVRGEEEIQHHKTAIQQSLSWERNAQFEQPSVKAFIAEMERERPFGAKWVSIHNLIADGQMLADKLQQVLAQEDSQREPALSGVIQPYLQLVESGRRCQHTHLLLHDIWRYFRYTWQTPYNATPGRQMFYLVRDAAQPFHPVIGIAALGSSLVQLTVRDDEIGWTASSFDKRVKAEKFSDSEAVSIVAMLDRTLKSALDDIDTNELVTCIELLQPSSDVITRLQNVEKDSRAERIEWLQKKQISERQARSRGQQMPLALPEFEIGETLPSPEACRQEATHAMYRAKRAKVLYELLEARRALLSSGVDINNADGLRAFWKSEEGNRAVRTLIRANKKQKVGINLMDIIVCGAIPPYNILLGGKLVAMLLAGPQVVADYRRKYERQASNIASQLKGQTVVRDPTLVFLGTTSLYASNSTQYNRIRIPTPDGEEIRYQRLGLTKGYGSVQFSADTRAHLANLLATTNSARLINNRFGEGVNPKLRLVSAGISAVGISAVDKFIKHRSQRIVYGVSLCRNTYPFLRGEETSPDFFFQQDDLNAVESEMAMIIAYWRNGWLLPRIGKSLRVQRVRTFNSDTILLSKTQRETEDTSE
ncbi:MAG: DUF4338 domain-containing protein [Caldilineaceae bacterium]|nr:DUF4338 domain-containing protein [Caldilineaceae bacterium]